MAKDPLFSNKLFGAVLLAGVLATGSGFVANLLYKTDTAPESGYTIAESEGGAEKANAAPVDTVMWQEVSSAITAAMFDNTDDPAADMTALVTKGEKLFKKCSACHTVASGGPHKTGPNLWNLIDRQIASADGYTYSTALQNLSAKSWNFEELNAFLTKPKVYAKGTKMSYSGMKKPTDRVAMLLYLAAQGEQ